MARQSRVDFAVIKAAADFGRVLQHYDRAGELSLTATKGRGDQVMIHCPFHDDSQASLSVNTGKGLFHCFNEGGCGARGNVLDFVQRMETEHGREGSLRDAAIVLADICGIAQDDAERPSGAPRAPKAVQQGKCRLWPENALRSLRRLLGTVLTMRPVSAPHSGRHSWTSSGRAWSSHTRILPSAGSMRRRSLALVSVSSARAAGRVGW